MLDGDEPSGDTLQLLARDAAGPWVVAPAPARGGDAPAALDLPELMVRYGELPLPPYIRRPARDPQAAIDRERYQTVYAREEGAVAAPTAGLHLTHELLEQAGRAGRRRAPT